MNAKGIKSKLSIFVLVVALLLSVSAPTVASASGFWEGFWFTLGTRQGESVTSAHYRSTTSTSNPWGLGVYNSDEGNGSYYSAYLIGQKNAAAASPLATAYTGPAYPYVYTTTYSNASQTNVRMVMFNPEWTTSVFPRVSGSWNHQVW